MKTLSIIFSIMFISVGPGLLFGQNSQNVNKTAEQVISTIIKNTGSPAIPNTVDVIKEGDPQTRVIGGETQHWETYEYMRDAVDQGRNKAIIFLGHIKQLLLIIKY
jgi:hypothetical protein